MYSVQCVVTCKGGMGDVAQLWARLTRYRLVVCSNTIEGSYCLLEPETFPSLFSTGWFQEQSRA